MKTSNANFPINDLLRRRLQTSLVVITLALSVASTLSLLLFSSRLGITLASATGILTQGLTAIFSQFILFISILIFVIGCVLTAYVSFLMMAQRTRDFGLIKAAGCPNSLVGGYFMAELLTTTLASCTFGIALGFLIDYVIANVVFSGYNMPIFWFAPIVFVAFFVLAIIFGLQPIIKASRISPLAALSPVNYYGLTIGFRHKPVSRSGLTWRIASRSLFRRQSASIRIIFLLSIVFVLLTVSVAGGIIASTTTTAWIQKTVNKDSIAIAQNSMGNQYQHLLSKFSNAFETGVFNYSDPKFAIPDAVVQRLSNLSSVSMVDSRLFLEEHVEEVSNFTVFPTTGQTVSVGDNRQDNVIVIGVNAERIIGSWFVQGRFLNANDTLQAVIGDSVSHVMYSPNGHTLLSDPLLESIEFRNNTFDIVGVCVDPLNNGLVTYVPFEKLQNITGISSPNLLLITLSNQTDRSTSIAQIKTSIQTIDPDLNVFLLNEIADKNANFLASNWKTIMFLPLFTLVSATLCLVGYMMLSVDEQRQEFAILRAIGAKPRKIIFILAIQSIIVLLSSFAFGIPLGTIITLIILMKQPVVTSITFFEITGWLLAVLAVMFILSLYPAFRLARASILKIMV
jgi:ABC-type antimicrobial peptide transport system permease subunit